MKNRLEELIHTKEKLGSLFPEEKKAYDSINTFRYEKKSSKDSFSSTLFLGGFFFIILIGPMIIISSSNDDTNLFNIIGYYIAIVTAYAVITKVIRTPKRKPTKEEIQKADIYSAKLEDVESKIQNAEKKLKNYIEDEFDRIESTLEKIDKFNKKLGKLNQRERRSFRSSRTHLKKMNPYDFEDYVGEVYKKLGYSILKTPKSGDGGIDLILLQDEKSFIVQCKRYSGAVSSSEVRAFLGTMTYHEYDSGKFVTTGKFSSNCYDFFEKFNIDLIDGDDFIKLSRSVLGNSDKFEEIQKEKREVISQIESISLEFINKIIDENTSDYTIAIDDYINDLYNNGKRIIRYISHWDIRRKVKRIVGPILDK